MDPFVLARNAFHIYCSEYITTNSSTPMNNNHNYYENAVRRINQRYEYFFERLNRLQTSVEHTVYNQNINSISNNRKKDTLTISSNTSKRSHRKHLDKTYKQRMPKILITVSCREHLTQQQPNVKIN